MDKYVKFYGKTKKELEDDKLLLNHLDNYGYLTHLAKENEISNETNDLQTLDNVMYKQALDLEKLRNQIEGRIYTEDGSIRTQDLMAYLQVLKQFSCIYDRANSALARRFLIHK